MKQTRLQKRIADLGYCSRRKAEKLILEKKIKVNDELIDKLGFMVNESDIIKIDNKNISSDFKIKKIYLAFNKPRYVVSTTNDPKNRKTVMDFFSNLSTRIYPIGRLDYDTAGLLLFTNDGEFANLILHPRYEVNKKYLVIIENKLNDNDIKLLENGIKISDNFVSSKAEIVKNFYDHKKNRSYIEIIIHEGKNHQIKIMFKNIKHDVIKLKRLEIGIIKLGNLSTGKHRKLTKKEIDFFKNKKLKI